MIDSLLKNSELYEYINDKDFLNKLVVPIGMDVDNEKYYMDLTNVSLMLIEGTTGTGKSILLDNIVVSLLIKNKETDVKFLFFDPKIVELSEYNGIPHLVTNCITNIKDSFTYIMKEIEYRENLFVVADTKNIESYNRQEVNNKIPHLFIVLDEFVEMDKLDEFKDLLNEIALNGRTLGIHLILATGGYLKNMFTQEELKLFNFIMTFELTSKEQAKYINISNGDLLKLNGEVLVKLKEHKVLRLDVPNISSDDIKNIVNYLKGEDYADSSNNG